MEIRSLLSLFFIGGLDELKLAIYALILWNHNFCPSNKGYSK